MTTMVHLSDTHFGTEVPAVVDALKAALSDIRPDIVTISGDLTQRATREQLQATHAFLASLPAELKFVIPGNHDIPLIHMLARLFNPYGRYHSVFGAREGVWCLGNVGILGYDATSRWRHTRGRLMDRQVIARIKAARSQLPEGAILIACAHQPLAVAWKEDEENILVNATHTAQLFAEHGVDMVLSGHVHVPLLATTQSHYPQLPRHMILSGAGTAISRRTRPGAPNSFNVIRLDQGEGQPRIGLTLMQYDTTAQRFEPAAEKQFVRGAYGWENSATA